MAVSRICGELKSFLLLKSMPIKPNQNINSKKKKKISTRKYPPARLLSRLLIRFVASTLSLSLSTRKYPPPRLLSRLLIRFVASTHTHTHTHSLSLLLQICYFRLVQMNCLHSLSRSSALPIQTFRSYASKPPCSVSTVGMMNSVDRPRIAIVKAVSGSTSSTKMSNANANVEEEISETYSNTMTEAMGAVLTYRHELGMNYNFIRPDLIVGSCLQTPEDVDKLRSVGVKTIFCLQQDPDLEYFGVDITAIRTYASTHDDIEHLRAEIRDFDSFDLRMRLPAVVSKLHKAINRNGGVTYIHCTAGLGRAPATALAYMFWIQGYKLSEANNLLQSKRSCFPKLDAIKSATADILTGLEKKLVTLTWECSTCSNVEVSGLDIGWGQRIPMKFDKERSLWILQRELPEGRYEYKYVVDGEWSCNYYELVTPANKDGHVNNYVQITDDDPDSITAALRARLTSNDPDLTTSERLQIRQFLEAYQQEG